MLDNTSKGETKMYIISEATGEEVPQAQLYGAWLGTRCHFEYVTFALLFHDYGMAEAVRLSNFLS